MSEPTESRREGRLGVRRALELIFRILKFALPHWKGFLIVLVLTGIYSGANSVRLVLIGFLMDRVVVPTEANSGESKSRKVFDWAEGKLPESWRLQEKRTSSHLVSRFRVSSAKRVEPGVVERNGGWAVTFHEGVFDATVVHPRARWDENLKPTETEQRFDVLTVVFSTKPPAPDIPYEVPGADGVAAEVAYHVTSGGSDSVFPILAALAIVMAIISVVIALTALGKGYITQSVIVYTVAAIRSTIFRHLSRLSLDYFGGKRSGDLISRSTNDVGSIQLSLRYLFGDLVQHPFTIVFSLALAFYVSWQLSLMVVPFLPLLLIPLLKSGRRVKKHGRGSLEKLGEVTESMSQLFSGIRVVKAFGMEAAQEKEFDDKNAGFIRSNLKMVWAKVTARAFVEGAYNLLAAVTLLVGGWLVLGGVFALSLGEFGVFLGAIWSLYQPLKSITRAYNTVQESLAGAERVFEVLEEQPTVKDAPGAEPLPRLAERIEFEGVSFRYGDDEPWVLRNIDVTVPRGSTVALVGHSGAGKSTLIDVLARFYDPVEGRITIDGRDIREGTHASLIDQIAYVGQDAYLFNTSALENLRHGRPDASEEEVIGASIAAAIHDEITAMPNGYETVIGDRGLNISGGQRQRITIARAILKAADILLLDEATSALDSESERKVQGALEKLMEGRTTFVIAHRLSTIRHADVILVLEAGRIVEQGDHEELAASGGVYARLLEMQSFEDDGNTREPLPGPRSSA